MGADVDAFLQRIQDEPERFPAVDARDDLAEAIDRRLVDGGQDCRRCGEPAVAAVVAHTRDGGDRWLDLCASCFLWLSSG